MQLNPPPPTKTVCIHIITNSDTYYILFQTVTLFQVENMASHDQSFRTGEAKGQTQEKTNQMMSNIGDKAQAVKDKTAQEAHSAWDKTAQTAQAAKDKTQQAAQTARDRTSDTAQNTREKAQNTAGATRDKASEMGQATRESAQAGKDNAGGFLQQTGEKVKGMAQGAADAVKQTFGMAPHEDEHEHPRRDH
ncbi:hypothetical protein HN51_053362 [Arachis hypogaea]|uniref:late embryogenesis abundant protein 2 n=1 Tax=Arachis ipaensis TaxID=130454 RepID=UPI000A2B7E56|nr:late embryogenesis abundant protein 2 [Arachis ipaensis]